MNKSISSSQHNKHRDLPRPTHGRYHRQEWAIIGAPCGLIQQFAQRLIDGLSEEFRFAYLDADHAGAEGGEVFPLAGACLTYTDKISYHRLDWKGRPGVHQFRFLFNDADAVLVNGNHFRAARQVVFIDRRKEDSLRRKLDRLDQVCLFVLGEGESTVYPWLLEALPHADRIPVIAIDDEAAARRFWSEQLLAARPPLVGLVLAGGRSERMGRDKGLIDYHGQPQREHAAGLLAAFCEQVFISCRPDQAAQLNSRWPALSDVFLGLGPMGAILSAFQAQPDAAWLIVATDLPLLDQPTLWQLVQRREPSKMATAFHSPTEHFPEPLIAIWEPRAYPVLLQFLAQGYSCPRKALINSDVELVEAAHPQALFNVNNPEELADVMLRLGKSN